MLVSNVRVLSGAQLADGNYSPGPYRRLDDVPVCLKAAPVVLPQKVFIYVTIFFHVLENISCMDFVYEIMHAL